MYGPKKIGFWSSLKGNNTGKRYLFLQAGNKYRVVQPFSDYSGYLHPIGEEWMFLGYSFVPYDEGLSLFITFNQLEEWNIPMLYNENGQQDIIESFSEYIQLID